MISYDEIRPVIDRLFQHTATIQDHLSYVKFELQEIMKALPPEAPSNGSVIDGWHASACALRAWADMYQLERQVAEELKTNVQP